MELAEEPDVSIERVPCQFCNRKFVPKSLAKHAIACERMLHKKRKTFDSAKQRIQGTELAEYLPAVSAKKSETFTLPVKDKSAIVQRILNTAHNVPSRKSSKVTSPNKSNYERCPYCDRTFGPKAFDRHLEWCKEQSVRIESKSSATQEAKERLEARIRYRAPSIRSKRTITREKYSPKSSISDCSSIHLRSEDSNNNNAVPSRKKSLETELKIKFPEKLKSKEPVKETNFIRQNVLRCSYRPKIMKKSETKFEKNHSNQNKKKPDYYDVQDWISANGTKVKQYPRSTRTVTVSSLATSSVHEDYPNPYLLAEHQLKELLDDINSSERPLDQTFVIEHQQAPPNHSSKGERRSKFQDKENISCDSAGSVKTISCQTDNNALLKEDKNFKTSPTSAFEKYALANGNRVATPVPPDFENESFLPPIASTKQTSGQTSQDRHNINRYPLISLSNLSLCSSVSIDIPDENHKLGVCKSAEVRGNESRTMKRSISASVDKTPNNKNYVKKNLKMENMLYGNEEQSNAVVTAYSSEPFTDAYDAQLDKLDGVLDVDTFDLANSFSEFENVLQSSYYDNDVCTVRSESPLEKHQVTRERGDSMASKMSIDSAYNSLNRKSPSNASESQIFCGKTSTPETDVFRSSTLSLSSDTTTTSCVDANSLNQRKLSKFCHECGEKFPLAIAKFCCECGVRRLVI